MTASRITAPSDELADFCRAHHIRRLWLFRSVLRRDFRPDSDVDVLVEFEPGHVPGLISLGTIELALSPLFGGRKVDLHTAASLNADFRDEVLATAEVQFDETDR